MYFRGRQEFEATVVGSTMTVVTEASQHENEAETQTNEVVEELEEDGWTVLLQLIQDKIAVEAFLEISEELVRGGRNLPDDSWIIDAAKQSKTWFQLMILILSIDESRCLKHLELIKTAPQGGELFERIRNHLLERIS